MNKMMTSISLFILILMCAFPVKAVVIYNEPFDADLCQRGEAVRWAGACKCHDPFLTQGRYCNQDAGETCETTKDCKSYQYCSYWDGQTAGVCHAVSHYPKMETDHNGQKRILLISGELMNHRTAKSFCEAVGGRMVERKDFGCTSRGVGCGNQNFFAEFKSYSPYGFLWLEENENDSSQAYYIDIADYVIYLSKKNSSEVTQAVCIMDGENKK